MKEKNIKISFCKKANIPMMCSTCILHSDYDFHGVKVPPEQIWCDFWKSNKWRNGVCPEWRR